MAQERAQLIQRILELSTGIWRAVQVGVFRHWLTLEVTTAQMKVLFYLYFEGSAHMGRLSEALGVTLSTITGIMDRLVEQGLVQRAEDPHDRRLVISRLTERGHDLVDQFYLAWRARMGEILARLGPEELVVVARGWELLHDAAAGEGEGALASRPPQARREEP